MAHYQKPTPDAHKILTDLAELIAASYKQRITLTMESNSGQETQTVVIDRLAITSIQALGSIRVAEAQADANELTRLRGLYEELMFAVSKKYPGETRHQTALRYIQQAEDDHVADVSKMMPVATAQEKT